MNAEPDTREIRRLTSNGWMPLTNAEPTYPVKDAEIKIDHIFYRGSDPIRLNATKRCTDSRLSDHFPVLSEVTIR